MPGIHPVDWNSFTQHRAHRLVMVPVLHLTDRVTIVYPFPPIWRCVQRNSYTTSLPDIVLGIAQATSLQIIVASVAWRISRTHRSIAGRAPTTSTPSTPTAGTPRTHFQYSRIEGDVGQSVEQTFTIATQPTEHLGHTHATTAPVVPASHSFAAIHAHQAVNRLA